MMSAADTPSEVLATRSAFGSVAKCREGCIHVSVDTIVLRLGESEYWALREMLSEAARHLAGADPAIRSSRIDRSIDQPGMIGRDFRPWLIHAA